MTIVKHVGLYSCLCMCLIKCAKDNADYYRQYKSSEEGPSPCPRLMWWLSCSYSQLSLMNLLYLPSNCGPISRSWSEAPFLMASGNT